MTTVGDDLKKTITSRLIFEESSSQPFSFAPSYVVFSNADGYFHMTDVDLNDDNVSLQFMGRTTSNAVDGSLDPITESPQNPDVNRYPYMIVGTLNKNPLHPKTQKFPKGNNVLKVFHVTRELRTDLERPFSIISLDGIPSVQFHRQRVPLFDDDGLVIGSQPFIPTKMHLYNKNGKELLVAELDDDSVSDLLTNTQSRKLIYIVYARG